MYLTGGVDFKKTVKNGMWIKIFYSTKLRFIVVLATVAEGWAFSDA